jgi:hypothetical protein
MIHPPSDILRRLLVNAGICSENGEWPAFVSFLPPEPDASIGIFDTMGMPDGRLMRTGERIEHPGLQIWIRSLDYLTGWTKGYTICKEIDAVAGVYVEYSAEEMYIVQNISRIGTLLPLGVEEESGKRRHNFSINAITTIQKRTESGVFIQFTTSDWVPFYVQKE